LKSLPRARRAVVLGSAALFLLSLARAGDPLGEGLTATYFSDAGWSSTPVRSTLDPQPSTDHVIGAWRGTAPDTFSATWTGSFIALHRGTYTFATSSDDGSALYVDGRLVVENGGHHAARLVSGQVQLNRGVHTLFVKYFQEGGGLAFDLLWDGGGGALGAMPGWALAPRGVEFRRFLASVILRRAWLVSVWVWFGVLAAAIAAAAWRRLRAARRTVELYLLAAGALLLFFVLPHEIQGDGRARFLALAQLIEWREVSPTAYSMVGPLASLPLYALGTVWLTPEWWCARFNTVVFVAGLWMVDELLRAHVDRTVRSRFLLLLVAASMFPYHVEGYYAELFTAMIIAAGLLAVSVGRPVAGWTAAAVGVVNTPAALAGLGVAAAQHTWDTRRLRHLLPVVAAAGAILLEAWIRRGSPFVSGYEGNSGDTTALTYSGRPGFSYPLMFGLLSVLFSFGKGLIFYAPGLALPVKRSSGAPGHYRLWVGFVAGLVVVCAKWWAWWGGLFWGPRFFLFASIPASYAIAVWLARVTELSLTRLVALFGVLTLSAWVAIDGAVFDYSGLGVCRDVSHEWLCLYVPEFSALWRPFVLWTPPSPGRVIVGVYCGIVYCWLAAPVMRAMACKVPAAISELARGQTGQQPWGV
jgi:hypothetical protein